MKPLSLRMMVKDVLHPLLRADVGVDFCGEDALVPQHILHGTEVSTVLNKVSGKGMAECVRMHVFLDAGKERLLFDNGEYHYPGHLSSSAIKE